jgi:hypothetical protein
MSTRGDANPQIHYVIELQYSGLEVRLLLNGIEIVLGTQSERKIVQQKVNGWLTNRPNDLVLYAGIPDPAHVNAPLDLKCLVFRGPHGRQPEESEALARFAERGKAKLPAGAMQVVWNTSFASDPYYGPWRWEAGRNVASDAASAAGAMEVVPDVIVALNGHNTEALARIFNVYIEENARAYGMKVERVEEQLAGWCESWTPVPPRNLALEQYSLTVEGGQRLLRIERKDGSPLFTADPKSPGSGPRKVYCARLGEGLVIVR